MGDVRAVIRRWYLGAAVLCFNTLLLFAALVFIAWALVPTPKPSPYSPHFVRESYLRSTDKQIEQLWHSFDRMGEQNSFQFSPWTVFRSAPFTGPGLTVDREGVRTTPLPAPVPRAHTVRVWAFGGSTMFGWGVSDNETIPAHLAAALQRNIPEATIEVMNFGQPYFYSSSELAYFAELLRSHPAPALALFLDGLNDSHYLTVGFDAPWFSEIARRGWEQVRAQYAGTPGTSWLQINAHFPLLQLARWARHGFGRLPTRRHTPPQAHFSQSAVTSDAVSRFNRNLILREGMASAIGVETLQFLQPVPWLSTATPQAGMAPEELAARRSFYETLTTHPPPQLRLLHEILRDRSGMYVDHSHYSEEGCRVVAETIAAHTLPLLRQRLSLLSDAR